MVPKECLKTEGKLVTVTFVDGSTEEKCKLYNTPVGFFVEVSEDANIKVIKEVT